MNTYPAKIVSKAALYDRLRALGFDPTDERLESFYESGLTKKFFGVAGGGSQRYTTEDEAARITCMYETIRRLKLGKPRASELAFWLCLEGFDADPALVAEHIERSVTSVVSYICRIESRLSDGFLSELISREKADWLGARIARQILRVGKVAPKGLAGDVLGVAFSATLRFLFRKESFPAVARPLRRVLSVIAHNEAAGALYAKELWDTLCEFALLLVNDERNVLLSTIRTARKNTAESILPAAQDAKRMVSVMAEFFPWIEAPRETLPDLLNEEGDLLVRRFFTPCAAAILLATEHVPYSLEMREELRRGEHGKARRDFESMAATWPLIKERLGVA